MVASSQSKHELNWIIKVSVVALILTRYVRRLHISMHVPCPLPKNFIICKPPNVLCACISFLHFTYIIISLVLWSLEMMSLLNIESWWRCRIDIDPIRWWVFLCLLLLLLLLLFVIIILLLWLLLLFVVIIIICYYLMC